MKVAIVGPKDSCERIDGVIKKYFKNLIPQKYVVNEIDKAYLEADKAQKENSAVIFTGIGTYTKTLERVQIGVPHIYVPHLAASIMKPIIELKDKYPQCKKVSIDSISDSEEVLDIFQEIGLDNISVEIKEYSSSISEKDYFKFHHDIQKQDKNSVAIVALGWVYEKAKKEGLKAIRLYPIRSTIKYVIKELLQKMEIHNAKESTIAVQIIKIKNEIETDQYKNLEIKARISNELVEYLKAIQGSIFILGWDEYLIYSTSGALLDTDNVKILTEKIAKLEKEKIQIAIGNGYGDTAYNSEINARKAIKMAIQEEKSSIYEVDNYKVKGPLFSQKELEYEYVMETSEMRELSENLKINPLYLNKIKSIIIKSNKNIFTSDEVAMYLNISVRSANRIIKKLVDSGYANRKISELTNTVGRPKEKVEFKL